MPAPRRPAPARTQWAQLAGEQVEDNGRVAVDVSINRALRWRGMDRTTVGPFIGYERYTKNLSHFTLGHGGYFSPQRLLRAGVAWEGLTTEGAPFVARARVAAGYQTHRADAAPYLPLAPDGRMYAASDQSGAAIDLQWLGVWRMTPRWQLGGGAGGRRGRPAGAGRGARGAARAARRRRGRAARPRRRGGGRRRRRARQ